MPAQNRHSEADALDRERAWARQLARERSAALASILQENPALPGPGAAAAAATGGGGGGGAAGTAGTSVPGGAAAGGGSTGSAGGIGAAMGGIAGRAASAPGFGGAARGGALTPFQTLRMPTIGTSASGTENAMDDEDEGGGDRVDALRNEARAVGRANRPGAVSADDVKAGIAAASKNAKGAKEKVAMKAAQLATKAIGEERIAKLASEAMSEFTDPFGRMLFWQPMIWMYATFFLGSVVVLPLHYVYLTLAWLGAPKFKTSTIKWFAFIVNNLIFFAIIMLLLIFVAFAISLGKCAGDFFCMTGLIKDTLL